LLRQRDFRLLFSAQAASVFGDRMVAVALAFGVLEIGGSASAVGLVLACASVAMVVCLLVGGVAEVWMLALLAGVTGAATGFFNPASTALMPAVVRRSGSRRRTGCARRRDRQARSSAR
jgi:MFS family permease